MKKQKYHQVAQHHLQSVVDSLKGRFVSLLVKEGEQRKVYSVKVNSTTASNVMFTDTNGGNRKINRKHILRATCADKTFKRAWLAYQVDY